MTTAVWAALGVVALLAVVLRTAFLGATVIGSSMEPTLAPGDRILVARRWLSGRPRRDDVVVVRLVLPARGGRRSQLMVKRVTGAAGDRPVFAEQMLVLGPRDVFVVGDNPARSFDSREFGPLTLDDVVGKMLCRLPRVSRVTAA